MAQRDRLKNQIKLPETKIEKRQKKKVREKMMGILAKSATKAAKGESRSGAGDTSPGRVDLEQSGNVDTEKDEPVAMVKIDSEALSQDEESE